MVASLLYAIADVSRRSDRRVAGAPSRRLFTLIAGEEARVLDTLTTPQLSFIVILVVAFGLLLTEWIRNDVVAVLIILALSISRVVSPSEALAGFGSEPAIIVAAIFVLSAALQQVGLSETLGRWIGRLAGNSPAQVLVVIMPAIALLSAFTHHVTTTAVMLPITLNLSRERQIPASKLLMPLSFAASLGTTITIIGAPAFLLASDILQRAGRPGLGIFSIAPIGLILSLVGTLFMVLVGRFLLPSRRGGEEPTSRFRLDAYFTELVILPDSPFLDKTVAEVEADGRYRLHVVGWMRRGRRLDLPFGQQRLRAGDVLLVRTAPEALMAIRQEPGVELHPVAQYGSALPSRDGAADDSADQLVQAVVAPGSDLIRRTIGTLDFRRRYGALVVGLWRRDGWIQQELAQIRLRPGDVLVLQGDEEALARVGRDSAFLLLIPFHGEARLRRKAPLAGGLMVATIGVATAFPALPLNLVTLAGAVAMVLTGCLTARQAYQAIDARIYVFIAGAIPLGAAMEKSGVAGLLASGLQYVLGGWPQMLILLVLFTTAAVVTQFMSDAATTALIAPVALALAQALGHPPEAYVVTVAMASVAAFLTPIGHHGNLLVYGPGRYQFADFVRVGTPLTGLVACVVTALAPLLWRG
jgi:di/tricarboxylate transporter